MTPLTPPSAASPADLLAVAQSKAVPPTSRVSGFDMGLSPPTPPAFKHPSKGVLFIEDEPPCYAGPCDARRSFWAYACGWSYDWRRCGAPDASEFSILATPIAAMTPAPMTPDIPQATMTPAPTTPDIHQATMTSAPTTPVSYPFQMEESRPPHQCNYPIYKIKGEDMRLQMSKGIGKGRLPAYEREYPLP